MEKYKQDEFIEFDYTEKTNVRIFRHRKRL